jgi:hypothetical protein
VLWVNTITAVLTFASLIGYAVVYTVFLKRATPQNIVIGGIAGAAPPLLGWATMTGMQGEWDWPHALLLVLIIFVWTPPHFWALAIFRREDYARALVPMLPVTHGVTYTRWQILFYTVLLVEVTVLPVIFGMSGFFYLGGALVLGAVFLWYAWRLLDPPDEFFAMRVFNYSIVYLMALFAFLLVDHWLMPLLQPATLGRCRRDRSRCAVPPPGHPGRPRDAGGDDQCRHLRLVQRPTRLSLRSRRSAIRDAVASAVARVSETRRRCRARSRFRWLRAGCLPHQSLCARHTIVVAPGSRRGRSRRADRVGLARPAGDLPVRRFRPRRQDRAGAVAAWRRGGLGWRRPHAVPWRVAGQAWAARGRG